MLMENSDGFQCGMSYKQDGRTQLPRRTIPNGLNRLPSQIFSQAGDITLLEKQTNNLLFYLSTVSAEIPEVRSKICKLLKRANEAQFIEKKLELSIEALIIAMNYLSRKEKGPRTVIFNQTGSQIRANFNNYEESRKNKKEINRIDDPKPISRTILETLAIAFTIAGTIWAIVYAIFNDRGSSMAMWESLEIFGFFFLLILIIYLIKK